MVARRCSIVKEVSLNGRLEGWVQQTRKSEKGRLYMACISPNGRSFPSTQAALRYLENGCKKKTPAACAKTTKVNKNKKHKQQSNVLVRKRHIRRQSNGPCGPLTNEEGDQVPRKPKRALNKAIPHVGRYDAGDDLPNWTVEHVETADGCFFLLYRDPQGNPVGSRGTALIKTGQLEIPDHIRDQMREVEASKNRHKQNLEENLGLIDEEGLESKRAKGTLPKWYMSLFDQSARQRSIAAARMQHDIASQLIVVDLFCGIGGFSMGAQSLGIGHLFGVDVETGCVAAYRENECGTRSIAQLLRQIDVGEWARLLLPLRDRLMIIASPPCQPYSCTGYKNGSSDERDGLPFVIELCEKVRPQALVIENVAAMLQERHASTINCYWDRLRGNGYQVHVEAVNCLDYSIAQRRKRAVVVAVLSDSTTHTTIALSPTSQDAPPTAGDALGDFGDLWRGPRGMDYQVTPTLIRSRHRLRPGCEKTGIVRFNAPAPTVLTTALHDNSYYRMVAAPSDKPITKICYGDLRALSTRHILRLQGFPDKYTLFNHVRFQSHCVGNAIPPPLARAAIQAALQAMRAAKFECKKRTKQELMDMVIDLKRNVCASIETVMVD